MALVSAKTSRLKKSYHHTFELRKNGKTEVRHTLLLNPQSLAQNEQARSSVTQTLGGAYVTDFGAALPTVSISGTTGYRQRHNGDGELRDGYEEFMHFRNEIYRKFIQTNDPDYELFWYNWEDEEYWAIQPTSFRLQRSVSEPLLYRYEFNFTCIGKANVFVYNGKVVPTEAVDIIKIGKIIATAMSNFNEVLSKFKR
jgi:hypothetical protein